MQPYEIIRFRNSDGPDHSKETVEKCLPGQSARRLYWRNQVLKYFLDDRWIFDGGNDLHLAPTRVTGFDIDPKYPF